LAKNTFSVHGVGAHGTVVLRKTLSRARLLPFLGNRSIQTAIAPY
jgi:hypothetical protein